MPPHRIVDGSRLAYNGGMRPSELLHYGYARGVEGNFGHTGAKESWIDRLVGERWRHTCVRYLPNTHTSARQTSQAMGEGKGS